MLDQYLFRERVAEAGMGVVWRADHRALVRGVPVTFDAPDLAELPGLLARFCRETHESQQTAIAAIDFGEAGSPPFVVMDHVHGATLGEKLRDGERVSVPRAVERITQVLRALAQAHAAGIVHADLRPEHIIIERQRDGRELVTLVDVGGPDDDAWLGAPAYLAPELIAGRRPTIASDLYAVGVILYELLTDSAPFDGDSPLDAMTRQLRGIVMPPCLRRQDRNIPAHVDRATLRALARAPAMRFADAASFAAALEVPAPESIPVRAPRVDRLRAAVREADQRGAAKELVDRYLVLALALSQAGEPAAAIAELEAAIELFMWDDRWSSPATPDLLMRLRLALARLQGRTADGPYHVH
jgi:serine/threonine-protein kinase